MRNIIYKLDLLCIGSPCRCFFHLHKSLVHENDLNLINVCFPLCYTRFILFIIVNLSDSVAIHHLFFFFFFCMLFWSWSSHFTKPFNGPFFFFFIRENLPFKIVYRCSLFINHLRSGGAHNIFPINVLWIESDLFLNFYVLCRTQQWLSIVNFSFGL